METIPVYQCLFALRERALGCLLGGAIGDALGRPNESRNPPNRRITEFKPWRGWTGGPKGTITDDTQLTMCLAESLVSCDRFDANDFAGRIASTSIRGIGRATQAFVQAYTSNGGSWETATQHSSGNGAAMRAAPIGIIPVDCADTLRTLAIGQARVTHDDAMACASSVALATAVSMLMRMDRGSLDGVDARIAFLVKVGLAIEGMEHGTQYVSRKNGTPGTLYNRLSMELPALLTKGATLDDIQEEFWSGAYVFESGPMAFACFLSSPDDFENVVVEAACKTRDSDTVAAIAGNLAGAFNGKGRIPERWLAELEYRDDLERLAIGLLSVSGHR